MVTDLASSPWIYGLLLAVGVGLGLPMGAAVVGAGALFGGLIGLVVVLVAQAVGLAFNWHLCRHWGRAWIVQRLQSRRRWQWLLTLSGTSLSWPTLLLLRQALLPMALVSACCALSATSWRPYAVTSLALVLRFALMVQAGALGVDAISGQFSIASALLTATAAVATAALAWMSGVKLRRRLKQPVF